VVEPSFSEIHRILAELLQRGELKGQRLHLEVIPPKEACYGELIPPLAPPLQHVLRRKGIFELYLHQVKAIEEARRGRNVLVVTGTASGKSLTYQLPVLEMILDDPEGRALFLFPTKALEQDQLQSLHQLIPQGAKIRAAIFDGDTPSHRRLQLKETPPHILISNPDILHLSLLPSHAAWKAFFDNLRYVVLDELHTYKGIFGSHVAHVLRRLRRIASHYGSSPRFIATSATIANPLELARDLTGLDFTLIREDGAPQQGKHFLLIGPEGSPYTAATDLLLFCLRRGLKTIAFTKARKIAELIYMWAKQADRELARGLRPYRAGYLPEERREIEAGLFTEKLCGVVATSALELGIDVGGLDACILVGYPGSITSTWQRSGRVGRRGREAVIMMIALPDALDQYFLRHPEDFFSRNFEMAVIDPENPVILADHLAAAADELPLRPRSGDLYGERYLPLIEGLVQTGRLALSADGEEWYSLKRRPQRLVSIRSIGESYTILDLKGHSIGTVDGVRALHECHQGAIYLHQGRQYEVLTLDLEKRKIQARPVEVDYYTSPLSEKETEILVLERSRPLPQTGVSFGRLKVTERVTGYEKRRILGQEKLGISPLELPPQVFETKGLWFEVPEGLRELVLEKGLHFMGGIHALEHAMISLFPLFALSDRGDIGGISYPFHPQLGRSAIFIYDGYPGGIGIAARGYEVLETLLEKTGQLLEECPCEEGCPSCVQSPRCGSGNKPLDKAAALLLANGLLGRLRWREAPPLRPSPPVPAVGGSNGPTVQERMGPKILVLDVETKRSAEEVGGWEYRERMGLAAAVTYDLSEKVFRVYTEEEVDQLLRELSSADLIIGFNLRRFDFGVLKAYTTEDLSSLPALDLLERIEQRLGFRLSLNHLAQVTLGESKTADGLQSLRWFKAGELHKVIEYCKQDVLLTTRLYEFGREHGYLLYRDYHGRVVRLPVDFGEGGFPKEGR